MRKFYPPLLVALMMLPLSLGAQTMTEENETLANYEDGYRLEKDVDFVGATVNGTAIEPAYSLEYGTDVSDVKINSYVPKFLKNAGLEFMSIQLPGNGIDWPSGKGLRSTKNERWIGIHDLREGQILVFDLSSKDEAQFVVNSIACNGNTGWADTPQDPLILEEISAQIHDLQDLSAPEPEEGEEAVSVADGFRYYKVINNGAVYIKFNGKVGNMLYRFQIWSKAGEAEVVSVPTLTLDAVKDDSRQIGFKPGGSTYGNPCTTWWGIVDKGEEALFLIDSDEIDHYDPIYEDREDEEGNIVKVEVGSVPVYKKIFDPELVVDGMYGEREYDPEVGSAQLFASDDEDGDGYVTIQAATVSSTGVFSDIVTMNVAVGVVTLNAPTFTWIGVDGKDRIYSVNWINNTLCGETNIKYTVETENSYEEYESLNDVTVRSAVSVKATVEVEGYEKGEGEKTVDAPGLELSHAGVGNEQTEDHNWDFQALSDDALDKINGIVDHYAIYDADGNVIRTYTVEESDNGEIPDEDDEIKEPVMKRFGWDASDNRNAARHWRTEVVTYEDEISQDEDGNEVVTPVRVGAEYAEDEIGLFKGLTVDNSHPSYSTMAIFTDKSGLYFMSKGTIAINPESIKYGEYIMLVTNTGTTITQYLSEDDLTLNINAGVYVYSVDIFTYDDLPEIPLAIDGVTSSSKSAMIYTIGGVRVAALQKGINIVKYADGSVKKVLVK